MFFNLKKNRDFITESQPVMTITNNPSDVFSDMEFKLMETLNERQLR